MLDLTDYTNTANSNANLLEYIESIAAVDIKSCLSVITSILIL